MTKKEEKEKVKQFAKQHGYDFASFLSEWNGYRCYEPEFEGDGMNFVGLPLIILVSADGNIRMSTADEAMQFLREADID
ncbi:hypothetical protein [Catenisphaera adipataccumulans]|jgi:hypothetical protein|uniref:Uncharacterized protein n=1 Tax=Catenisphaera adipataccumulans TaxID=700500 RepID=A0A7W8FVR3_9FIRM|nr:hypothetical protein [Catenisphaera adipataccumulans]MBB5183428.1 hypothetical protein [Catenisphaera adipataccumulans]